MDQHPDELICVGHILGAQGIKGWVKVYSNTSPRDNIIKYGTWVLEQGSERKLVKVSGRAQGKQVLARIEGCEDRNQADGALFKIRDDPRWDAAWVSRPWWASQARPPSAQP